MSMFVMLAIKSIQPHFINSSLLSTPKANREICEEQNAHDRVERLDDGGHITIHWGDRIHDKCQKHENGQDQEGELKWGNLF